MAFAKLSSTLLREIRQRRKSAHKNSLNGVVSLANPPARRSSPANEPVRLIGSIRRECIDHIIVLGEVHLRQILQS